MAKSKLRQLIDAEVAAKHAQVSVGNTYFLSDFYDKKGWTVRVTATSTARNMAGFNSTVSYEIVEAHGYEVDAVMQRIRPVGYKGSCNAANLYATREGASFEAQQRGFVDQHGTRVPR